MGIDWICILRAFVVFLFGSAPPKYQAKPRIPTVKKVDTKGRLSACLPAVKKLIDIHSVEDDSPCLCDVAVEWE